MNKRRCMRAAAAALILAGGSGAAAQTLPSVTCFSPGMVRAGALYEQQPQMQAQIGAKIEELCYVRDLSVLNTMLDEVTLCYDAQTVQGVQRDRIRIMRDEETLFDGQLNIGAEKALLMINGACMEAEGLRPIAALPAGLLTAERMDLEALAEYLISGESPVSGAEVQKTYSDDGLRLTRLDAAGERTDARGRVWKVEGFLRHPAGRAPKDTAQVTMRCDEDNELTLDMSSLHTQEIVRKEKEGVITVQTSVKLDGKLDGKRVTARLTIRMKNAWKADGEALSEQITITASFEGTDRRPEAEISRLYKTEADGSLKISLVTHESGDEVIGLNETAALSFKPADNTMLDGQIDVTMQIGGQAQTAEAAGEILSQEAAEGAWEKAMRSLAAELYRGLPETVKQKIQSGL